ncbi:hypothetical protein ACHQM5_003989 [Ranunculus cassubicifolius]
MDSLQQSSSPLIHTRSNYHNSLSPNFKLSHGGNNSPSSSSNYCSSFDYYKQQFINFSDLENFEVLWRSGSGRCMDDEFRRIGHDTSNLRESITFFGAEPGILRKDEVLFVAIRVSVSTLISNISL